MGFALHGMIKFSLYKSLICCCLNISLQLFYIIGKYRRKCISGRETAGLCILCSKMVCRKKSGSEENGMARKGFRVPYCLKMYWCGLLAGQKWEALAKLGRFSFCCAVTLHKGFN